VLISSPVCDIPVSIILLLPYKLRSAFLGWFGNPLFFCMPIISIDYFAKCLFIIYGSVWVCRLKSVSLNEMPSNFTVLVAYYIYYKTTTHQGK
jgi:hypothetical protein